MSERKALFVFARTACLGMGIAALIAGCGGGDEPVELSIEQAPMVIANTVVLHGRSFVPNGSSCPASSEYVIFGALGPNTIAYQNTTTGVDGPVFQDLWVCNSAEGRSMTWTSNPISLVAGVNVITVTMTDARRSSSASISVRNPG